MQIVENKAVVFETPNPTRITTCIPKSHVVGARKVAVHWDVPEATTLRKLGYDVPAPISGRYDWPGRFKPFDHQRKTAEFLTMNRRAFCFNEQGTGKTASAIWAADFLMRRGLVRRALVVCPLSIMDSAWRADLASFAIHRTVDIAYGAAAKRKKVVKQGAEFVIINYDGLAVVEDEIARGGFDLFVVDEATHYKNAHTRRWKTLDRLLTRDSWLWLMTGTPAAQGPEDAYGLAKIMARDSVPRTFGGWRDLVMYQQSRFKWLPKHDATETVHRTLQPAIRYTKAECLDLPDMIYTRREVPMTSQQSRYYNRLKKDMILRLGEDDVTAANAAVNMNKLLQIAAGAVYTDESETVEFDVTPRYNVLRETIDESSNKVLVFVPFRSSIEILTEKLRADGIATEAISGSVSVDKRNVVFSDFQTKASPRVLVIQPQAAAHGVTLTAADTVVWWSPTASLETFAQANARVHRAGQTNKCTVVQLYSAPVEQRIYKLLADRINVHSEMINLYSDLLD